jgi:hypothetical protein
MIALLRAFMKIKNDEEYQALLARIAAKNANGALAAPERSLESLRGVKLKATKAREGVNASEPAKRQGVKEAPILSSLRACDVEAECSPTHVTLLFRGARLFTLNEIYALLQYRRYVIFDYKKQWHVLVRQALSDLGEAKPHFDKPCKITLFRQGSKAVDRDSLMVMFKYIIDALKDEPKKGLDGIFPDDNPDIVYDDEKIQTRGEPLVGIRVDLIDPAPGEDTRRAASLFDRPQGRDLGAGPLPKAEPARKRALKKSAAAMDCAKPSKAPARPKQAASKTERSTPKAPPIMDCAKPSKAPARPKQAASKTERSIPKPAPIKTGKPSARPALEEKLNSPSKRSDDAATAADHKTRKKK